MYSAAGPGESTTDLAWDGHALIYENSDLLAEAGVAYKVSALTLRGEVGSGSLRLGAGFVF